MTTRMPRSFLRVPALLLASFLVAAFLALSQAPAQACSCAFEDPARALADAPAAFVGTLVGRQQIGGGEGPGMEMARWTFEVEAVLKGDLHEVVVLEALADNGAMCGLSVGPGERTGLILYGDGLGYTANLCSTYDADDLMAAGEPRPPSPGGEALPDGAEGAASQGDRTGWVVLAAAVALSAGILGGTAWFARRRPAA